MIYWGKGGTDIMRDMHDLYFKIPKDWHLVIIIMAITGIAALILLLGSVVPKLTPTPRLIMDKEMGTYQV